MHSLLTGLNFRIAEETRLAMFAMEALRVIQALHAPSSSSVAGFGHSEVDIVAAIASYAGAAEFVRIAPVIDAALVAASTCKKLISKLVICVKK